MESTRPIRALMRGLDALTVLNLRDGATVSEVAQEIRLPRTTVYRILETLCNGGFVFRDAADDRYRLTVRVRGLSSGFVDEAWVTGVAKPFIDALCREIVWPISVATLSGTMMMVRETTDHATPLATSRYSAGQRVPLLSTSAGRTQLAFCPAAQRDTLLEIVADSREDQDAKAGMPRDELLKMLADIKSSGYASTSRTHRQIEESSVSVPITLHEHLLAVLSVRFVSSAVPLQAALERFLPKLRQCAAQIGASYLEQQAGARSGGAPEAAA
jgi:IclR family mhp operon transcriptional activator